ncbi:MAG: hypothetical protein EXR98_19330 [Gemmataceae bacterium]|nr:hypothetical protein [Gemmataceae bacterium]
MASAPPNDPGPPGAGLPPVQPPSGRFLAQLFVIPGMIILVLVVLYIGSQMMVSAQHEPAYFLQQLDSDNEDIRWRGASDLAQILKRTEPATLRWKTDPKFALDIAERLDLTFQQLLKKEKAIAAQAAATEDKNKSLLWRPLQKDRDRLAYLAATLGEFHAPVGAPVLCAILKHDASPDLQGNTQQRRMILWALINMGVSVNDFAKVPAESRQKLIAGLKDEAAAADVARAARARTALYYLDKSALPHGALESVSKVDDTLAYCALAEDQFVRKLTALSFSFWDGEQAEPTLLKLAADTGWGTLLKDEEDK